MIKCIRSLKDHNEGASLIAVLSVIIFVMTLGAIVTSITITNIRMRQVEESSKRNFYSAEEIMDEIASALNNKASDSMQAAYNDILSNYNRIVLGGGLLQDEFTYQYVDSLMNTFWNKDDTTKKDKRVAYEEGDMGRYVYVYGYYNPDDVRDLLPVGSDARTYYVSTAEESTFSADYVDGIFTLHNIKVDFVDASGYETTITTDMVFHTPKLNFDGANNTKEYMKYALIADDQILVGKGGGYNTTVNGSVYAGPGGIQIDNCDNVSFLGTSIITRGDISITSGTDNASFGSARSNIWAENLTTAGTGSPSSMKLNGNIYVADDLTLGGRNSKVTLEGNYYGYNFRKQYDGVDNSQAAEYSSIIAINGRDCTLDMSGLNYLLLAGRTYITKGVSEKDVVLGESVSVRTNQLAYYVPERYLDVTRSGDMVVSVAFSTSGMTEYSQYAGVNNVMDYLSATDPIAVYRFKKNKIGASIEYDYRFYLNFKSEQAANDFFAMYNTVNGTSLSNYGENYADAIMIGSGLLYTLKGDLMYRNTTDNSVDFTVERIIIDPSSWQPGNGSTTGDGFYYSYADRLAKNYKSLQTYLENWEYHSDTITSSKVRFEDTNISPVVEDKSLDPVTDALLGESVVGDAILKGLDKIPDGSLDQSKSGTTLLAVVGNNKNSATDVYLVDPAYTQGIVIAKGNVRVENNFKGMIIAGGTIEVAGSGVVITADERYVAGLFADDASSASPVFSWLFSEYGGLNSNVIGLVKIDNYLSYENWTKMEN